MIQAVHLLPKEVAKRLRTSKRTLERLRANGEGPPWFKLGAKVLYPLQALEAYEQSNLSNQREAQNHDQ